jgi:hypothetical protein
LTDFNQQHPDIGLVFYFIFINNTPVNSSYPILRQLHNSSLPYVPTKRKEVFDQDFPVDLSLSFYTNRKGLISKSKTMTFIVLDEEPSRVKK